MCVAERACAELFLDVCKDFDTVLSIYIQSDNLPVMCVGDSYIHNIPP